MKRVLVSVMAAGLVYLAFGPAGDPVVAQDQPTAVTADAPALSVAEWVKGEPVKLEDGKGKNVYIVEFWATWCPPCRESIPHLTELQKKYKDKGLVVVAITDEEAGIVKPFVEKMGDEMDYRVALDKESQTYAAYDAITPIPFIPSAFVIDKEGRIAWVGLPLDERMDAVVEKLLGDSGDESASNEA
jgi:thiol-disulfide isomerase/thioredoxin